MWWSCMRNFLINFYCPSQRSLCIKSWKKIWICIVHLIRYNYDILCVCKKISILAKKAQTLLMRNLGKTNRITFGLLKLNWHMIVVFNFWHFLHLIINIHKPIGRKICYYFKWHDKTLQEEIEFFIFYNFNIL